MMKYLLMLLALGVVARLQKTEAAKCTQTNPYCHPEQIHIAFGEKVNDITVTWSTLNDTEETILRFGKWKPDTYVSGARKLFIDGGKLKWRQWIHNVKLKDLKFDTTYVYIVGSRYGWSEQFSFKTPPAGENWPVRALIYGDLGVATDLSLPFIKEDVAEGHYDFIIHVGDFAYDMKDNNGTLGNQFMNDIQPIAAHLPYMVCPGNHEEAYNFSHYKNRFSMPGNSESMFYSYNVGPIHFVTLNTDAYYNYDSFANTIRSGLKFPINKDVITTQFHWLENDLKEANKPENRQKHPWIIFYGHRPFYCSNSDPDDKCRSEKGYPHRVGMPEMGGYGLESLLHNHRVDLAFWGHEHSYERMWPLYNNTVYNGSYEHPYVNPGALVQFTTGSAGCKEETREFFPDPLEWSAFRSRDYGYTRFVAHNRTHLHFEQISTHDPTNLLRIGAAPKKIDEFWLVKDHNKPNYVN